MNLKHYFLAGLLALAMSVGVKAQQPYGGCWHPNDIENWSPETDPTAKFNRSRVPLAKRFIEPQLMKANSNQYYEGQICNATILFNMCSLCPSQGANNFTGYQPTYWQYMDKLVYWAGSASEGIIIPPPAGSIDAAHAQGVKVLGQVFFPPKAFGGDPEWVKELTKKNGTSFPYAKKLYEIAKYFGFDGWFINQETAGSGVKSETWAAFIKEFNSYADANGDTQMEIMYYDAMTVIDAPILKSHKNSSQFLEYGAVGDQRQYAKDINCTEAETFGKIYGGVQAVKSGLTGYNSELNAAFPKSGHVGSLALFCPEEKAWKDNVRNLLGTSDDNGPKAYAAIKSTFENEEQAWVNIDGDPSTGGTTAWRGISGAVLERSAITSIPFVSSMCVGVGKHRFVHGEKYGSQDWNHSGVQSVLPTWRWWIENRGDLSVSIDWDDAFNYGSCFKISGTLNGERLMRLYKTNIALSDGVVVKVVYKTTGSAPALCLSTKSSVNPDVTIQPKSSEVVNGWTVAQYDLSALKGQTLYMIALNMKGSGSYEFKLGEVAVLPASYAPASVAVENLTVAPRFGEDGGDVRVTWDYEWTDDFDHFDVYVTELSGKRTLVGQTRDEAFYIPSVVRNGLDDSVNIEVVPVMKDMEQRTPAIGIAEFPKAGAPIVTLKMSRNYIKVGETVTVTATGTGSPTGWHWSLPATLQLVDGSLDSDNITVKALEEGTQILKVESTNNLGTSETAFEALDVLPDNEYDRVHNVVLQKKIVSYSGCTNSKESPANIIDGVTNPKSTSDKWCNISPDNWVIFDCQSVFRMYGFKIYDCKAGPEKNENICDYTIELSLDGKKWTKVVNEKNREADNIKEDYIVPSLARYIRFSPSVNGTLRVWEFEAYGVDVVKMTIDVEPKELRINTGETKELTVRYNLNGDAKESNFNCTAVGGDNIIIGDIIEDAQASTFTIEVTGGDIIGEDAVTVTVNNGGAYKEYVIDAYIDNENRPNVLAGLEAALRHYSDDYGADTRYDEYVTEALTDGDTAKEACEMVENPSSHTDDFWAIFEATDVWNLSKVKISIPDSNKGVNDNDKSGYVNNSVSIYVGDKLDSMTKIKTFDNLAEVSTLEYIFPEYRTARYLAVVCNLNPYFYPSLAEVEAFEQVESVVAFNDPAEMIGWEHDIVAEGLPSKSHVNSYIEDEDMYSLYSATVHTDGGMPEDGFVRSANGYKYQIAPYGGNNALTLKERNEEKTLTFANPSRCERVHFLVFSGTDMSAKFSVKANYEDGSESEYAAYTVTRWDRTATDDAGVNFGSIVSGKATSKEPADKIDDSNHYMFDKSMTVDPTKKLVSLTFKATNFYYTNILAVSKTGYREQMSAIEDIIENEGERVIEAIYNLQGLRVANTAIPGIYIVRYDDGTTKKIIIK